MSWWLPRFWHAWKALLTNVLSAVAQPKSSLQALWDSLWQAAWELVASLASIALVIGMASLLVWTAQGGLGLRSRAQQARVHVQSVAGLRVAWLMAKALVIAMACASVVHHGLRAMMATVTADLGYAQRVMEALVQLSASRVGVVLALLVVADVIVARQLWRRSLRMTREEVRRELRDTEGDSAIRGERTQRQRETALEP